jgi:hypothetical protein
MSRRAARVVLLHRDAFSMMDDWIDHIEIRRDARAIFAVWANKYGEDPMTGRRRWFDWSKMRGLKSPMVIYKAIEDAAEYLNVQVEWVDAIPLIASIDWLTAAVIASNVGYEIPKLPDVDILMNQRSLRSIGRVTIGAEWGYDMHKISLTFERWVRILRGEYLEIDEPYWHEGQRFTSTWSFDGIGRVVVTYDDGGVGWDGNLGGLELIDGPKVENVDLALLALSAVEQADDSTSDPSLEP